METTTQGPCCRQCGNPVPKTNDVLTILRFWGEGSPHALSCHYFPGVYGSVPCAGGKEYVKHIPQTTLNRLCTKMQSLEAQVCEGDE